MDKLRIMLVLCTTSQYGGRNYTDLATYEASQVPRVKELIKYESNLYTVREVNWDITRGPEEPDVSIYLDFEDEV